MDPAQRKTIREAADCHAGRPIFEPQVDAKVNAYYDKHIMNIKWEPRPEIIRRLRAELGCAQLDLTTTHR